MVYQSQATIFMQHAKKLGVTNCIDGLGMLVGQAAQSFERWTGVMPDVEPVLMKLRQGTLNQFIQIQDGFEISDDPAQLIINAINGGGMVRCVIHGICEQSAADFYAQYQFDIEEALIECISEEVFNEQGEVWLAAKDLKV